MRQEDDTWGLAPEAGNLGCMSNEPQSAGAGTVDTGLLDARELAAWRGMLRVHAELTRALDADLTQTHGLALSSYEVLLYLADAPEGRLRMAELADSVLLSRSGLTRLVDRLERQGLIERVRCDSDARGFFAAITDEGRRVFDAARRTHLAGVRERFLSHFSADELEELGALWARVLADSNP
jgi:DNA-binding MarR family transcriptional regulator